MRDRTVTKRNIALDYVRAICVIWVVGFWHLTNYTKIASIAQHDVLINITMGVLGTFTFLSAYFLGRKRIKNWKDVKVFWIKRLKRIYPMFCLSCLSLYAISVISSSEYITSFKQLILTLVGLSCIITPAPHTVWFISMMIFFYSITPIINYMEKISSKVMVTIGILALLILLNELKGIDERLLYLTPVYCSGLIVTSIEGGGTIFQKDSMKFNILFGIASIGSLLTINNILIGRKLLFYVEKAAKIIYCLFFIVCLISMSQVVEKINKNRIIVNVLQGISYGSMIAYLFHRQYYLVLFILGGEFKLTIAYLLFLPILLLVSYYIQLLYDKYI